MTHTESVASEQRMAVAVSQSPQSFVEDMAYALVSARKAAFEVKKGAAASY